MKDFINSFVKGNTIRFKWALDTEYGDKAYTIKTKSANKAHKIAQDIDLMYPAGENFAALVELAEIMNRAKNYKLVTTTKRYNHNYVVIENKEYHILYGGIVCETQWSSM